MPSATIDLPLETGELDSIRGFGRRVGRSHPTIIQAINEGRITAVKRDPAGKVVGIYWRQAAAEYSPNVTLEQPPAEEETLDQPLADEVVESVATTSTAPVSSYGMHRARTEEFRAKHSELEYLTALGLLIPAGEAREANFRRYRTLRDKMLNIPDRIATLVTAERDPARAHQIITEEIKRVLSELANDATTEAAGGAA